MNIAKEGFTQASLGLLANQRKRQLLIGLLKSLRTIKTLQRTDIRLSEMLEEEDYPGAIQLCLECQKAASTFKHYSCISELNSKLQDTLEQIEEQLDVALSKICKNFDINHYTKVMKLTGFLEKHRLRWISFICTSLKPFTTPYFRLCLAMWSCVQETRIQNSRSFSIKISVRM